jgi:hypothetical protein
MRGPYERLKYDLRRLWECPVCKRRERTPGSVTFNHCLCQIQQLEGRPVVMTLVEDGVQRVAPPVVIKHAPAEAVSTSVSVQSAEEGGLAPESGPPQS